MTVPEQQMAVEGAIRRVLPNARVRAQHVEFGWIIEVVDSAFGQAPEAAYQYTSEVFRAIDSVLMNQQEMVWKLCTAKDELSSFSVDATLRTVPSHFDEQGVWTSVLTAADAYLQITEFDAERLLAGAASSVEGIETLTDEGRPLLPYKPEPVKYRALDVEGHQYAVSGTSLHADASPRRIIVEVGQENIDRR